MFFGKPKSSIEVINDVNGELVNFYKVVQRDYVALEKEIKISLHSRELHRQASAVYNNPDLFGDVKRAWAVWVLAHMSFAAMLDGSFGYDRSKNSTSKKIAHARESFSEELAIRLQDVQVECADAIRIIESRDSDSAFFYCDPPYFNSDCGHYDGYSLSDFEVLLKTLSKAKGKFLLSSYPSPILSEYVARNNWKQDSIEMGVSVARNTDKRKRKLEVLTRNY